MPNLKYLYYFSSPDLAVIEVKRLDLTDAPLSDIYKWLVVKKASGKVWELDFQSMKKSEVQEFRTFAEGTLVFDVKKAMLTLFKEDFSLVVANPEELTPGLARSVEEYVMGQHTKTDLYSFRELRPSDLSYFVPWISDEEVIRYSMTKFHKISSSEQILEWFKSTLDDRKSFQRAIVDPKTNTIIGYAGIAGLNDIDQNGEFFIFIGNKNFWGKGIATAVTKEIVRLGFSALKLHRIFLTASDKNSGAIKAYEKAGFRHEGKMREAFFRNSEYSNKIIMGILRSEYYEINQ